MKDQTVFDLMQEYIRLKDEDKAIRKVRNEYMTSHKCLDPQPDEDQCIHRTVGIGGYPAPLCEVCQVRNDWYEERQKISRRRTAIMQRVRRLVTPKKEGK